MQRTEETDTTTIVIINRKEGENFEKGFTGRDDKTV